MEWYEIVQIILSSIASMIGAIFGGKALKDKLKR